MILRTALALTASGFALQAGVGVAQETMSYETGQYEYAQPSPELDDDVVTETATDATSTTDTVSAARSIPPRPQAPVFVSSPTIQSIDPSNPVYYSSETSATQPAPATRTIPARAATTPVQPVQPTYVYVRQPPQVIYAYPTPVVYAQPPAGAARVIYPNAPTQAPVLPVQYGYGYQAGYAGAPAYLPAGAQVVAFDRNAWLEECRARLDTYESDSDRGEVIGALIGGVAGGVLGNRIAGSGNRTAGTLIGAGAGALAGMAAGDAIEDGNRRRTDSYSQCQAYLDDYMQKATASAGTVQYSQPGQYMLVPVTVAVPQRAVYRDGTPVN
ncbi:glycine zipper 2TM domain-containing protein [Erythrobacter sp.]|uniref:glycine zipper 2TM domain-containing protein n=1 Tax=Erythrobacter sp. TaxID=1042 RepID=UPI0025C6F1A3|nr:glycine zipper 2TM domain-containing protein [Erythrobacter sp.]